MSKPAMTRDRYLREVWNASVAAFVRWRKAKLAGGRADFEYLCFRNYSTELHNLGLEDPIGVGLGL